MIKKVLKVIISIVILIMLVNTTKVEAETSAYEGAIIDAKSKVGSNASRIKDIKCNHLETISKRLKYSDSKKDIYEITYGYSVTINYNYSSKNYSGSFSRMVTEYKRETENSETYIMNESYNSTNPYYSSENVEIPEPAKQLTPITVNATNITSKMDKHGTYYINIELDNAVKVEKAPIVKVKIGEETRKLAYYACDNKGKSLTYKIKINNVDDCEKTITCESITGGKIDCIQENTTTTMNYDKVKNKEISKVEKFILVKKDTIADINGDLRVDSLDVEELTKNLKDINGDGVANNTDIEDLKKAINNQDLMYVNFIKVNNMNLHGDINEDKVINMHDYLITDVSKYQDINGDGRKDNKDKECIQKALKTQNPAYLLYIKLSGNNKADVNKDGIINIDDIFQIKTLSAKNDKKGDINGDGKIDIYDQIAITQMLYNGDTNNTAYFKVPEGINGDVNQDGIIDRYDAELIAEFTTKGGALSGRMDANRDGKVDIYDVATIINALNEENGTLDSKKKDSTSPYKYRSALLSSTYFIEVGKDKQGDVNGDGFMDLTDVEEIAKSLLPNGKTIETSKGDITGDGKVDLYDAIEMAKVLYKTDYNDDGYSEVQLEQASAINYEYKLGDVNSDGEVNVADVVALNMYIMNKDANPLTQTQIKAADVVNDGVIDTSDSALLMNYVAMLVEYSELGAK